jgi:hypothetical protein
MDNFPASIAYLSALFALRCALPVLVTLAVGVLLKRFLCNDQPTQEKTP